MIRELRAAHARLAVALLVVPPALLGAALATRDAPPRSAEWPSPAGAPAGPALELAPGFPVEVNASWDSAGNRLRISARAVRPIGGGADPLLYWAPTEPAAGGGLPAGARFLAAIGESRPAAGHTAGAGLTGRGWLVLVSRPDRRVAATTPVVLPPPGER